MKKVLHYVYSMNRGGIETFIMNVFRNIDRGKINFGFLYSADKIGDYGPEIKRLGGKVYHVNLNRLNGKIKHLDNYFLLKAKLKRLSKEYDYFHIHADHAMVAYLVALAAHNAGFKHIIVHSHNSNTIYSIRVHNVFKIFLHRLNITRFACGIEAGHWLFGDDNFTVIHNGIDLKQFCFKPDLRKKVRNRMGWENKNVIGCIGRLDVQKNQKFLIRAFNEYEKEDKDAILILIGAGKLEEKLREEVHFLGLDKKVKFLGIRTDVNELYQGMDLFVLPSLFEGLPVVMIEAQAADLPSIISKRITEEVNILPNVYRLSLTAGPKKWASEFKKVLSSASQRLDTSNNLVKVGYDIKDTAKRLQNYYIKGTLN